MRSMKKAYLQQLKATTFPVARLAGKKTGAEPMLGSELDLEIETYLKKVRDNGGIVNRPLAAAAAIGLVKHKMPSLLKENGGTLDMASSRGCPSPFFNAWDLSKERVLWPRKSCQLIYWN